MIKVQGQSWLHSKTLSQKKTRRKRGRERRPQIPCHPRCGCLELQVQVGLAPVNSTLLLLLAGYCGNEGCGLGSEHGSRGLWGSEIEPSRSISFSTSLEGTTPVCEDIGRSLLTYGRRIPLAEWESRIQVIGPLEEGLEP